MICQVDDSDNIACTLGAHQDSFEFKIQDFSEWREVNDHHMDTIFEDLDYNKESDEYVLQVFQSSMVKALQDYDTFIFAC